MSTDNWLWAGIFDRAANRIEPPGRWVQSVACRDANGQPCGILDPEASCWCSWGAMMYEAGIVGEVNSYGLLTAYFKATGELIIQYNDAPGRTQQECVAALRKTANYLRAELPSGPTVHELPPNMDIRSFQSGATRNTDSGKLDYEGFLSPAVLERFAEYMHQHRLQPDGTLRDSDNWQKGIPLDVYMKSGYRHFFDWWKEHRGIETKEGLEDALCAVMFNTMGYLSEVLKAKNNKE